MSAKNPEGIATYFGYHFKMYLPHKNKPVTDCDTIQPSSTDQESIDAQEEHAIVYAWPVEYNTTGRSCFAVGVAGNILQSNNVHPDGSPYYTGSTQIPAYNAAMPIDQANIITSIKWVPIQDRSHMIRDYKNNVFEVQKVEGIVGIDGQRWVNEWMVKKSKK